MSTLTRDQATQLKHTMEIAREGRATLAQLGAAHDLAQNAGLPGCAAELRAHVRALAADHHEPHRTACRDVAMGVVSGIVTHVLLGAL
jgi:hypothetical protein